MIKYYIAISRQLFRDIKPKFDVQKHFLTIGQAHREVRVLTPELVNSFCEISGDTNPIHTELAPRSNKFKRPVVHGALLNSFVSSVIGTKLPGAGTIVVKQELNFPSPCYVGEEISIEVVVKEIRKIITVDFICRCSDKVVLHGYAKLVQPIS